MILRVLLLICMPFVAICNTNTYAHLIDVRIYANMSISQFDFKVLMGSYDVVTVNKTLITLDSNTTARVFIENNRLAVSTSNQTFVSTSDIRFRANQDNAVFNISSHNRPSRNYDDNLTVKHKGRSLWLINNVDIEKYVAGVVQAEGGIMKNEEFFKMQAVACRTYVLRNIRRHAREGFHMCDREHCQVYHGKSSKDDIVSMTHDTRGFVIVDKNLNFITAAFHANCGGETVNSEHVWTEATSYMKSVTDTFCVNGRHAFWEYRIKTDDFLDLLRRNFNFPVNDSLMVAKALSFNQEEGRRVFFLDLTNIHLKYIRAALNLRSTFFSIFQEGDELIFKGRGFGHGVGICQEGAMSMILAGFSYEDVIKYYFTDVYIISYEDIISTTTLQQ